MCQKFLCIGGGDVCRNCRERKIYKTRSNSSLLTGLVGRRIEIFCCAKYTLRFVPVYKTTFWSSQCPVSVSAHYGKCVAEDF